MELMSKAKTRYGVLSRRFNGDNDSWVGRSLCKTAWIRSMFSHFFIVTMEYKIYWLYFVMCVIRMDGLPCIGQLLKVIYLLQNIWWNKEQMSTANQRYLGFSIKEGSMTEEWWFVLYGLYCMCMYVNDRRPYTWRWRKVIYPLQSTWSHKELTWVLWWRYSLWILLISLQFSLWHSCLFCFLFLFFSW